MACPPNGPHKNSYLKKTLRDGILPGHKVAAEIMHAVAENMIVLPFGKDFFSHIPNSSVNSRIIITTSVKTFHGKYFVVS